MSKPYLAVSELTNTIYIVDGKEKYDVSEEALNATRLTHRAIPVEKLEQIRSEIEQEYNKFRNMSDKWDERACGLGTALEIIDKANKEQDEWGLEHDIINNNSGI